jgi:hypothetical protein
MKFSVSGQVGFRYDNQCMHPANSAAFLIREALEPLLSYDRGEDINWKHDVAVVVSNWQALHARGPSPLNEESRTLERVYVAQ